MTDDDAHLQPVVAAEFSALADQLETLADARWDTPSLCDGWRVREVIAHVTMAARYSGDEFMARLQDCHFDFTRLSNQIAAEDARLPTADLVAGLRSEVMQHWTPPGGGYHGALNHVVIHSLDATVPLGSTRRIPDEAIRVVLDDLTQGGGHARFGIDIEGRRLSATDMDWTFGSGNELCGSGEDLALVMCGRTVPAGRVAGLPL
ncbi:maleylpyruvate isomerase family mycothiol-dependent enzyme [Rhodococcus tibetensis]|uniref:Maleylpyruvate isomerase family mycothiol-dependent enzyme n=1 Tax=Rhodococcus tibetensis TaxID=2965064 RepID=A0ABT1Q935_9NOCA|nr:maleylpyruvate isomerase family mycothiol-dependent enzyme [Rhodococcus sp. FXJ9.536]MCQ4118779.1 maleylpyruvate isomerase family mycothiol-dependent enzyme [Rhodococcus sp. FXJ9.536]